MRKRFERERQAVQWICGGHAVAETLAARPQSVRELWVEHEHRHPAIGGAVDAARAAGVQVRFVSRAELDRVSGGKSHQGLAAKVFLRGGEDFDSFLRGLSEESKRGMFLLALDQIQDPRNLGACARSALNLGAAGIIVPERRSSPAGAAAVEASAGAIQKIPLLRAGNLAQALASAKEAGFWIYGAAMDGRPLWSAALNLPLIMVLGSEGQGMRPLVRSRCDEILSVPQTARGVESLNASCAASVLLYEVARRKALS